MKEDKYFIDYKQQPGLKVENNCIDCSNINPKVSIITSYYNAHKYMNQTINCVLNQTFQYWEWIIVDDGSNNEESIEYLRRLEKIDNRIKVFHKENEGLAKGRDFAIKNTTTNLILPLDADDLIEPTYIETQYWALTTNPDASWSFSNSLGFGKYQYFSDKLFDSDVMKKDNQITATALIRKEKILELGGYGVAKRYVNEDWHLWLRMLANNDFPVQTTFYGFWYRRNQKSLLSEINDEKNEENSLRLKDLNAEAKKIQNRIVSRVYSQQNVDTQDLKYYKLNYDDFCKDNRDAILYIIPELGFNNKFIKSLHVNSRKNRIYVIIVDYSRKSQYANRQNIEQYAIVYNLPTFIDKKYFLGFIEYIRDVKNIKHTYVASNCKCVEKLKECFKDCENFYFKCNQLVYTCKILQYYIKNSIFGRCIRKIYRKIRIEEGKDVK